MPIAPSQQEQISLRDYFAAAALQGLLTNQIFYEDGMIRAVNSVEAARQAYVAADEMLKRRLE